MKKSILYLVILISLLFITTGCKQDDMEDIDIAVTNYPNEYIINKLYGDHANIESIYPDDINIETYKVTNKQKKDYSNKALFIYNGLIERERKLAIGLLDINSDLKIIDTAYVLEENYSTEELWLNPNSLLMMAKNVQLGLNEYITSSYLKKEINSNYDKLKISLSELDADYRVTIEDTPNKTIVVNEEKLKYLEIFGLNVICISNNTTEKEFDEIRKLMDSGNINYIYNFKNDALNENTNNILAEYPNVKVLELHKIDNITDKEREDKENYITLMKNNLELLKQELYQEQ